MIQMSRKKLMNDYFISQEYLLEALNDFNEDTCSSTDFLRGIRTAEKMIKDAPSRVKIEGRIMSSNID